MRIGIDARFYGSLGKGLGRYTEKLIEHLEELDQDNEYIIFLRRENFAEYIPKNSHFKKVVAQFVWYGFAEQTCFVWMLYRYSLDLVHFPHFNVPIFYRRPFVVTIHDLILVHYPTLRNTTRPRLLYVLKFLAYRGVIASAITRASHIITVSHFTERDIITKYPQATGKLSVTYEAADDFCRWSPLEHGEIFLKKFQLTGKRKTDSLPVSRDILHSYFLYVGNAYPHKNLAVLFAVAKAFPEKTLVLVGREDFFYKQLKQQSEKECLRNVVFTGFLTDGELAILYRFARVYLFPSLYEGFGLPPLEAMTYGTPVVASERGSLPEVLGEAALYFDPMNASQLITLLRQLDDQEILRQQRSIRGYRQVSQYHFRDMAHQTLRIYQQGCHQKTGTL
jgi:glycosyltransferase involved in cell wall biosynthesis